MKFLLLLILFLTPNVSFSKNVTSESFRYSKVYECGPKKYDSYGVVVGDLWKYFLIHFDNDNNVVILHGGKHFKSFEKTSIPQLYFENGGEITLKLKKQGSNYIFTLKEEVSTFFGRDVMSRTLIFDELNLTYQTRTIRLDTKTQEKKIYEPYSGFCHKSYPPKK